MCVEHTTYIHTTYSNTYILTYIHTYMLDGTMSWAYQTVLQSYESVLFRLLPT
eukprot:COSAG01_NODE_7617_length_3125_cov_3.377396_3_plen_53_part_00